jgi:hypothetical protein
MEAIPTTAAPAAQATTSAQPAQPQGSAPAQGEAPTVEDFFSDEEIAKMGGRKIRLKVDGKESVVSHQDLIRDRQKYEAANKRFQEAKDLYAKGEMSQKQLKDFVGYMKTNTGEALKHLGIDPRQFAESLLMEAIQYEQLTPEQRELKETKGKLSKYESEAKTREEQTKRQEFQVQVETERKRYDVEFSKAMKAAGIESDAFAVARLAQYMQSAIRSGNRDVSPMDFVDALKADFGKSTLGYLKSLPADKLLESIPEEILARIRQADLARVKAMPQQTQRRQDPSPPRNEPRAEHLSSDQFRKRMLERLK